MPTIRTLISSQIVLVALALFAGCARPRASTATTAGKPNDQQSIQGTWKLVKCMTSENHEKPLVRDEYLIFDGNKFCGNAGGDEGKNADTGTFSLDPLRNPKQIDIRFVASTATTQALATTLPATFKGIYKLEGDELMITFGTDDNRPSDFKGVAFTLKRQH